MTVTETWRVTLALPFVAVTKNLCVPASTLGLTVITGGSPAVVVVQAAGVPEMTPVVPVVPPVSQVGKPLNDHVTPGTEAVKA